MKGLNSVSESSQKSKESSTAVKSDNSREHWKKRLSLLSPEEQAHIAKKYYGGHYPWKG